MPTPDLAEKIVATPPSNSGLSPDFFAVPGDAPRWLIPCDGKGLSLFLASWSPYRLSSRVKWGAIRLAHRLGMLQTLPKVQTVRWEEAYTIDWRALGWNGQSHPVPLVYIGTPGPARKAVIHLVDPVSGLCGAVAKVPLCAGARRAIVREANMLSMLGREKSLLAPRLLEVDRERGIATQTFVAGKPGSRRFLREYWEMLRSLLLEDEHTTIYHHTGVEHERWSPSHPACQHARDTLDAAVEELCDTFLLPACWVHGDFAPWNIRNVPHHPAVLIDWEDAERGGLPLQDAFHFLHMQDFLFGRPAKNYSAEVDSFAKSLRIPEKQCRKLEVAYLVQAYRSCSLQGHQQRAKFLLKCLTLALRPSDLSKPLRPARGQNLHLVKSHSSSRMRAKLIAGLIAHLNHLGIPYCILSGYENQASGESDVDIMFRPCDVRRIPDLLVQAARSVGALLVQSIQHETSACYFVLAAEDGEHITYLDLDCYTDYRRDGRTWFFAEEIIANRTSYRDFYVPAVEDEFIYYFIKKVLKQSINFQQLEKLKNLALLNPVGCRKRMASFWRPETTATLLDAILGLRLEWLQSQLPSLLADVQQSPLVAGSLRLPRQWFLEAARFLRRILSPTGFSVVLKGGSYSLRSQIAEGLMRELAPAFRRVRRTWAVTALPQVATQIFETWAARIRSTLLIHVDDNPAVIAPLSNPRRPCFKFSVLIPRRDLIFTLHSGAHHGATGMNQWRSGVVHLNADIPPEEIVQVASRAILERLAARMRTRLSLSQPSRQRALRQVADKFELGSAGVD